MNSLNLYFNTYRCESPNLNEAEPPKLVVIHGWGLHGGVWDDVMPALLQHFEVTVVDLPGMGRSPVYSGEYDLDYLLQQVLDVAPEQAVWLGWSLGGMVAMAAAARYPQRVLGLIAVGTAPQFVRSDLWHTAMNPELLETFIKIFDEDWEGTLIRFLALQCKGSASMRNDIRALREMLYFHGIPAQKALRGGLEILQKASLITELPNIQCPSLYVFGEHDHLVPVAASEALGALVPQGRIAIMEGVSHVPFVSEPDIFMTVVNEFLQETVLVV